MVLMSKILLGFIIGIPTWFTSCLNSNKIISSENISNMTEVLPKTSFYNLEAISINGETVSMSEFKGKKIIVLNVASKCGYTPQYAVWEAYYEKNKDSIVVLGFPCNQFLKQEPGTAEEIQSFCTLNYGVTFPMFDKVKVKGDDKHPIYQWLTNPEENGWNKEEPSWNFCKYLIDEEGRLTHFFSSKITPDNVDFQKAMAK